MAPTVLAAQSPATSSVAEADRLRNSGQFAEAITLLKLHLRSYPDDGDAIRMLAQTQYWAKDFAGARATYERALKLHPEDTALRRQYEQFVAETASQRGWLRLSPAFHHDDQPLDRIELQGEAGWYVQPASSLALRVTGLSFRLSDTASRSAASAVAVFSHSSATAGSVSISGGVLHRSFGASSDVIGSAEAAVKLTPAVQLRGSLEREGYFYTEASLSTPVMTNSLRTFLTLHSSSDFMGELSGQLQQFPDDNSLTTAYAWILAPVLKSTGSTLHVGYSGAYQNASELRFELEHPQQTASPTSAAYDFSGRYSPYYTPQSLQTHSIIAALAAGIGSPSVFRFNGSYAVLGSENAPQFRAVSLTGPPRTVVQLTSVSRDTHPWNARATLELNSSGRSPIVLGAETARTAFYSSVGAFASWTLKF